MAHKVVKQHFAKFAEAKLSFVRALSDCAERPEYLQALLDEGIFIALKPLLYDAVTVQSTAALALGRVANFSPELAQELATHGLLADIVATMSAPSDAGGETPHAAHLKAGAFVLRCVAKHSIDLARACIEAGCVPTLSFCLEQLDTGVREAAAAALTALASHDASTASAVAETGSIPLLCAALQEPEAALKRTACAAIGEIAGADERLARQVVAAGGLPFVVQMLKHGEAKVRKQACLTLCSVVKHSTPLAEAGVDARIFPTVLVCLQDNDAGVRKAAATLIRDVVKHGADLAKLASGSGSLPSLVEYATTRCGNNGSGGSDRLPATLAIGFISSYSPDLAQQAIEVGAVPAVRDALIEDQEVHLKAASVWALGQLGKHSPLHANALAKADVLRRLLEYSRDEGAGKEDLQEKSRRCLRAVLAQCSHIQALQALLADGPPPQLQLLILSRILEGLKAAPEERRAFLGTGGLKLIQALADPAGAAYALQHTSNSQGIPVGPFPNAALAGAAAAGGGGGGGGGVAADPDIVALVEAINATYPAEVVAYLRPTYAATLADKSAAYEGAR